MATTKYFKKGKKLAKIESSGFTVDELIKVLQEEKKKKKDLSIIVYKNLQSIYESEDKKAIIFSFENDKKLKFNLPNGKFYHMHNNKLINFSNISITDHSLSSARMSAMSKEVWIKTFFNLIENLSCLGRGELSDIIEMSLSKRKYEKDVLMLFEQASKQEFIQKLDENQLELLSELLGEEDYTRIREIIRNKKDYCWLFENYSNIPVNIDRHDGTFLYFYQIALSYGCLEYFKYSFENYRYVFTEHDWDVIKYLVKNGYEATRLLTYICRDMPNQGLDYYDHDRDECSLHILRDYVRMNLQMKNDFEKYPRYLRTYHDITIKNYNIAKNRSFNTRIKKAAKALEKYHYKNDIYSIVAPKSVEDLIEEGTKLNHCVASYAEDVANKETAILFLRKNTDLKSSLVTIEIKDNRIIQAKGKNNSQPQPEEKKFIDEYKKYLSGLK